MKWMIPLLIFTSLLVIIRSFEDPYKILGLHKSATVTEIRKAYKQLAKEWHPDKNKDAAAADRFVEITQAYEFLTDPERKNMFDAYGRIKEPTRPRREAQYRQFDPFDEMFSGTGFRFRFSDQDITLFHKLSITSRAYENILVPKSSRTPYLILFYADWCFPCLQVEPVWRRVMEELEPVGVGIATVHSDNEKPLARKVGISSLPCLILLLDGRPILYKEPIFSVQKVVEFVRSKMPYRLVPTITDDTIESFLSGWHDNRVRAIVFQKTDSLRLRFLLAAFYHRHRVAFGFVPPVEDTIEIRTKYQVSSEQDALLVFNEITERPVASVSMSDIPVPTLHDVINNNYYLLLPRLSSQAVLDGLCPAAGVSWANRRLCVVLVSEDTPEQEVHRQALRRLAMESTYPKDRVRYMYLFQEKQTQFLYALTSGENSPREPLRHVLILCRRDNSHVKYEWVGGDETWENYNSTKQFIESAVDKILHSTPTQVLTLLNEAVIGELIDEHTQGVVSRFFTRLLQTVYYLQDNLGKEHILPAVSLISTLILLLLLAYYMSYLLKLEEMHVQEKYAANRGSSFRFNGLKLNGGYQPQLKIHEMRAETYNGLVRLLRPGCRTILLLTDTASKPKLLPKFHKCVWPYRRNKTLLFGTLNLERGLAWFAEVLRQSLAEERDLTINPKNCVGTVLALNGLRKYLCMYHAKHPECLTTSGSSSAKLKRRAVEPPGSFIGFDDTSSDSEGSDLEQGRRPSTVSKFNDVIYVENLLDGLPNWLDRLFEGTTRRYYLNYWPDFIGK